MKFQTVLLSITTWLLIATALTPLIVSDGLYFFPFVFAKAVFYRGLVGIALITFLLAAIISLGKKIPLPLTIKPLKHPVAILALLFFGSAIISTLLAENTYRAFFGDMQRGEGLFGFLHYGVFLILALVLFKRREWVVFFSTLLGTGVISILYAWLQYVNVSWVPFALDYARQPGSFSGNSSYLASFLILLIPVTAIVFSWIPREKRVLQYSMFGIVLLSVVTIFLTAIRGAILGLGGGLFVLGMYGILASKKVFIEDYARKARRMGGVVLTFLILSSSIFLFSRESPVWLRVPGLGRLTKISLENPSVITRLIALRISKDAFLERPVFGWGLENYSIAYNKHYDPSYSFYAEDWFDRAHNRLADIAVTQGGLGLVIYTGLFGAIFYVLHTRDLREKRQKDSPEGMRGWIGVILIASFVAYIIQNLFLFDQFTSYVPFFALLGYIAHIQSEERENQGDILGGSKVQRNIVSVGAILLIGVLGWSLYAWNYIPVRQALEFKRIMALRVGQKILAQSDLFLTPYNFMQAEIRAKFVEIMYNSGLLKKKEFNDLVDKALVSLEDVLAREPYEPRNYSRLIESYNERAKEDPAIFKITEEFARKAVALSPKRQGLLSHLSFILSGQGRYEESIEVARGIVALDNRIAKSHYQLAISLALAADAPENQGTKKQQEYRAEAEQELDKAMDLGSRRLGSLEPYTGSDLSGSQYYLFLESDLKNVLVLYRTFNEPEKMARVIEILASFHPNNKDYRHDAIVIYRTLRSKERLIVHAEELAKLDPTLREDLDVIIDLARKGNWGILDTL